MFNSIDFEVGSKTYKLRLPLRQIIALEKVLGGKNPITVFTTLKDGEIPSLAQQIAILYHAMITDNEDVNNLNDVYDIYEKWVNDGHSTTELVPIITELYQNSGLIPKNDNHSAVNEDTDNEKN